MIISQDQNAGQNRYIKRGIKSFETVGQSKCLETTLTYQNSIHEEINRRLKQEILLSFSPESLNFQFAIQKTASSVYDCTVEDVEYICNSNSTLCLFYFAIFVVLLLS